MNFEDIEKSREEELRKKVEEEKKRRYDENRRSFREAKRRSIVPQEVDFKSFSKLLLMPHCESGYNSLLYLSKDEEEKSSERVSVTPGKLKLTFEELEKERQEQRRKQAGEEAKQRLLEEKKAFQEAKQGMVNK